VRILFLIRLLYLICLRLRLTLLLTLFLLGCSGQSSRNRGTVMPWSPSPSFDCGIYLLNGKLRTSANGSHVLVMREKSPSSFDVVLLGGEMKDVLDREGAHVGAKVYFPQPVRDSRNSVAYLQGFIQGDSQQQNPIVLSQEPCGQRSKLNNK
jgi:hypothetical protein